ncbi:MAG TPA: hypothetical protein VLT86_05290 [Vicinamibacterales bacterium]|nr:hypothetical protein [Vicinamibacterales bacterium]
MTSRCSSLSVAAALAVAVGLFPTVSPAVVGTTIHAAVAHDESAPLQARGGGAPAEAPHDAAGAKVEQTTMGAKPALPVLESFDGLGAGFSGPHGTAARNNPSDNSLAVGPNHIVQIVNSNMAIFSKKGSMFDASGKPLYGPVPTNTVFKGFGGSCEQRQSGDAVVRYDQLADRWLFVLPLFSRAAPRPDQLEPGHPNEPAQVSVRGRADQPGPAAALFVPPPPPPPTPTPPGQPAGRTGQPPRAGGAGRGQAPEGPQGPYSMCYAVSTSSDPLGSYYRYEFLRPLFPDYPRPAIWPDGYYVPSSTSDNRISETVATQKHACVAERAKMLKGEPASEQCVIIENVNFLNNADIDGKALPPAGAPNIMMAGGGRQLDENYQDDVILVWQFHVDWAHPENTKAVGPEKIAVAPYHYLCNGQLTNCVPQPGAERRLDAQGDKIMQRLVYRRIGNRESIVAVHSVNTEAAGGGVRWYEFRVDSKRAVTLYQQGTYAPEGNYRWMASPGMDRQGNIGIGYSFGGPQDFAGQRFAARLANDPKGQLTFRESVLAAGEGVQTTTVRWEDYTTLAMDPSDDCTFWYVGDYMKKDAATYSTKIGAFKIPGCR